MPKLTKRDKYLRATYDLTEAQYMKMWDLQQGKCAICLKPLNKPGGKKRAAAVDHDHSSGRVRGLLCYHDNRFTIGRLRSSEKLKRVIAYLDAAFDGRVL